MAFMLLFLFLLMGIAVIGLFSYKYFRKEQEKFTRPKDEYDKAWDEFYDKRQSSKSRNKLTQYSFDIIFGIVLPILFLFFDPFVFHDKIFIGTPGELSNIRLFAYCSAGFAITALIIFLSVEIKSGVLVGIISGALLAGAILASVFGANYPVGIYGIIIGTGIVIAVNLMSKLATSMMRTIMILASIVLVGALLAVIAPDIFFLGAAGLTMTPLGIFGFTPFITAFVFLQNGVRAFAKIQSRINQYLLLGTIICGIIFVIGIPLAVNWETSEFVSHSVYTIVHSERKKDVDSSINNLQLTFWCPKSCYDDIVRAYMQEQNPTKQQILSEAYLKITGTSIEHRVELLIMQSSFYESSPD